MKIILGEQFIEIDEALFKDYNLEKHTTGKRSHILKPGEEFNWRNPKFDSSMSKEDYKKAAEELSVAPAGKHADNEDPTHPMDSIFGWVFNNPKYGVDKKFKVKLPSNPTKFNPNGFPELVIYSMDDSTIITYMLLKGPRSLIDYEDQFVKELDEKLELDEFDDVVLKLDVGDMETTNAMFNNSADTTSAPVSESIEKHEVLNPKLWGEDEELLPEVKVGIEKIVNQFVEELKENEVELKVLDTILVGSNASYNYTPDSDLDVHIIADTSIIPCEYGLLSIIYNMARSQFNSKYDVTIHDVPIELYVEDMKTSANSNGIYSLKSGWIKKPTIVDIPEIDISDIYPEWEERAENLIKEIEDYIV